jgi:hypothetical protein
MLCKLLTYHQSSYSVYSGISTSGSTALNKASFLLSDESFGSSAPRLSSLTTTSAKPASMSLEEKVGETANEIPSGNRPALSCTVQRFTFNIWPEEKVTKKFSKNISM